MKVFISYSINDMSLVHTIANHIKHHADVFYWDKSKIPGKEAWPTIFNWIEQSELILAVITDSTVSRAMSVGQEIGHAKAKDKTIIPIVGPNVPNAELGFLSGITYQSIQHDNPGPALSVIEQVILDKKQKIDFTNAVVVIGGILALIWLASKK